MMQEMKIPTYLRKYISGYAEDKKSSHQTMTLSSLRGEHLFEI